MCIRDSAVVDSAAKNSLLFLWVGLGTFTLSYISFSTWMITGERQSNCYRREYFKAILNQNISYFDRVNPNELTAKISTETFSIQSALGEKVSTFLFTISMSISGFVIGFIKGWQLTLVLSATLPFLVIAGLLLTTVLQKSDLVTKQAFQDAGALAEQAFTSIRTVFGLNGEEKEIRQFNTALYAASKHTLKYGIYIGVIFGLTFFIILGDYSLGFWAGSRFIENKTYNPATDSIYSIGDVMSVFFSVIFGAFALGQASPCLKAFALGQNAAAKVFQVIDTKTEIIINDPNGYKADQITGNIQLSNVRFTYPTRTEVEVLKGINLRIEPGKKYALVGASGCGKSTVMQLIERFYDTSSGQVLIDGRDIKSYNLKSLRHHIGYVGQEPVLFNTSIRENLLLGNEKATEAEMYEALKKAKAYDFVMEQEMKLDTVVGTGGGKLSGGQKQRLAIARAILKNPTILLLDEATSALDRTNEAAIQATLDEISMGKTTIAIAHRLTTIRNADVIFMIENGVVAEEGSHNVLMERRGKYFELVQSQESVQNQDEAPAENSPSAPRKVSVHADRQSSHHLVLEIEKNNKSEAAASNQKVTKEGKPAPEPDATKRLYAYSKPDCGYLLLGVAGALLNGGVWPILAIILAQTIYKLSIVDVASFRNDADQIGLYFLYLAIAALVANTLQFSMFAVVSERLTRRLREQLFRKIMRMHIGWFDEEKNQPGKLSALLAADVQSVNGVTGTVIGLMIQNLSSFIIGLVIAFIASWKLTLITLGLSPIMIISGKIQADFQKGFSADSDSAYKDSGSLISESVCNMRTVASFGNEDKILGIYDRMLIGPTKDATKKGHISGFFFGISQFAMFGLYAIVFYIGALFNRDDGLSMRDMFMSIFAVMFAAFGSGQTAQMMPDMGTARNAARRIFEVIDANSAIDYKETGKLQAPITGNIEFVNVHFTYPTREKKILNGVSLSIPAGKKVAFVGPSGCGKSTLIQLLQRFYDPDEGTVLIDGRDIREYDVGHLRKHFGVVSQEPVLFNGTIEFNIKYTNEQAPDEEMKEAARLANAADFIEKNEYQDKDGSNQGNGYQRKVGTKGSQMSGGQKQRIAIARAIMKKPKVYLFDEATSALDAVSEKIVQDSLNKLMVNTTSVTIAHRLSTIRDSDEIYVFEEGKIIERGKFDTLLEKKGFFYKMEQGILDHKNHP
eukprot:TRINITY_DN124_c0_g1_i6.p1 TRINITY_DN124_c0_g1~~TRINITY_DN124_c0_g1_i6.p1  ORF type:complete len:1219 (+),score=330.83 TRINITY_DN124_c0_g1_i6:81-3659(+)